MEILSKENRPFLLACLLVLFVSAVFSSAVRNGFTNWDDDKYVTWNNTVKNPSLHSIRNSFVYVYGNTYLPVTILSYIAEYSLFRLNPRPYHTTNVIFHLLNCLLVFELFSLLCGSSMAGFIVAILFGVHPMHVESVAWISERKDVLYTFFFLGSMILYLSYLRDRTFKSYFLCLLAFLLSLLSKPMAVTLPAVLILLDYFRGRKIDRESLQEKVPFFFLGLIFGLVNMHSQKVTGAIQTGANYTLDANIVIAVNGMMLYLKKLVLPVHLSALYPVTPKGIFLSAWYPWVLLALTAAVLYSLKHTKKVFFGAALFLVTIAPVLQFVPIGQAMASDRYTYFPYLGLFFIFAMGFARLYRTPARPAALAGALRGALLGLLACILLALSFLTVQRIQVWKNPITLWTDVISQFPRVVVAHGNRGNGYRDIGQDDKALADYTEAVTLNPCESGDFVNRAGIELKRRQYDKAIADYSRALELDSHNSDTMYNLGYCWEQKGKCADAISLYNRALQYASLTNKGARANIYAGLGNCYWMQKQSVPAISYYKEALKLNPGAKEIRQKLALWTGTHPPPRKKTSR